MKQIKVSLPDKHAAAVKKCAKILGVSQSLVIRECINHCEHHIISILLNEKNLLGQKTK